MPLLPWDRTCPRGTAPLACVAPDPQSVTSSWTQPKDELPDLWMLRGTGRTQSLGSLGSSRGDPLPPEGHIPTGHTLLGAECSQHSTDQKQIFHTPSTNSAFTPLTQYSCQTPTSIKDLWAQIHIIKETLHSPKAKRKTY